VSLQARLSHLPSLVRRDRLQPAEDYPAWAKVSPMSYKSGIFANRDDTDLAIFNLDVLKAPCPLWPILQVPTIAQQPRRPTTTDRVPRRAVSRSGTLAVQHSKRTASGAKRELSVADQLVRERDDRGGVAEEQDAFVRPREAAVHLGDEGSRKPARRSCSAGTVSPFRDGYHTEDQESSISGKYARRALADEGRGCNPVPGSTGEYHSERPVGGVGVGSGSYQWGGVGASGFPKVGSRGARGERIRNLVLLFLLRLGGSPCSA
jgi:hypothetical protein